jgi:translocation and assembly module TamB
MLNMTVIRRLLHVVAWIGTAIVLVVALALIASQTPWFRDWARRTLIREAKQYLNGELTVGRLSGNLFFGVSLSDVAVDMSGDRVVAVKTLTIDYSIFQLLSKGIIIDGIALTEPSIHLVRDAQGWNVGRLVKAQRREADREGPRRPLSLPKIVVTDGTLAIDDAIGSSTYTLPKRIEDFDVNGAFEYAPVHFTVTLDALSFRASTPSLTVEKASGGVAVRDDNLYVERLAIKTGESSLNVEGVIEQYLRARVIKLATTGTLSLPELGRILPVVSGYAVHPTLTVRTNGPADRMALDLDIRSEAGIARGQITADLMAPDFRFVGPLHVERFNLAHILKNPAQRSDITGEARIDVTLASQPAGQPALDRLRGSFAFRGPHALAFGYEATRLAVKGSFAGPRLTLDAAAADAYGGYATTHGSIVLPGSGRVVAYDLQGNATRIDLRRLPPALRVPKLATDLSVAAYHVRGTGSAAAGSATLNQSAIEGATIGDGTTVRFETGKNLLAYGGNGRVAGLNVRRLGTALGITTLDDPRYDGVVNGTFDVSGSGSALARLDLTASGTLTDSSMLGTHVPQMTFKTVIANAGLAVDARGQFDQLNPAVVSGRKSIDGNVSGTVDGTFRIADMTAPFTASSFSADGHVTIAPSLIGGVQVEAADVEGRYEREVADFTRFQVKGPDVTLDASGRLALDRTTDSKLEYHVIATDISELGELAGQKGLAGSVALDGTITGNAASMRTTGTLNGSSLAYGENRALDLNSKYSATVPELDFVNARVEATTDATFLSLGKIELTSLHATTTYAQKQLEFTTTLQERTRSLDARGTIVFHPDHQELHLPELAVRTQGIEWTSVPGTEAAVQYGKGQLTIKDLRLASADQTLDVGGSILMQGEEPTGSLEVHARNVDIAQLETLLLQNRGLSGRLTADATLSGTLAKPIVDGKIEVRDGGFQAYKYQSLVADVDYLGNRITLDAALQQAADVRITAKGTIPTSLFEKAAGNHVAATAEDAVDVHLQTTSIDLAIVQGFTTQVANVAGTLQADVRVTGSGQDPHLEGYIEIRDGGFAVPRAGTSYSGLDTRIDLQPDRVTIRRFEILDENGEQLAVSGQLAVHERQVGAVDVTLESQNFEIIDNELGDVGVGTNLKITGELLRPRVEGEVRIAAGRLEVDKIMQLFYDPYSIEALPEVVSAERSVENAGGAEAATRNALRQASQVGIEPEAAKKEETAPPETGTLFERLALDVRVRIPDNLVVRGRRIRPGGPTRAALGDINITVGGDFVIRKEPAGPLALDGVVNTVRGTYQFQGRQFEIARDGTIRFTGEPDLNPVIDITATRQIPDTGVEARVRIRGSLKQPELQLSSTPPLEESDILAMIVFNRPINDLGTNERASLAATAGGIATGFIATPLGESIGRALDLDLFELTTTTEGDTLGAGITVGEQIGERTFIKLRQQFGERPYTEFLLEYRLADFLRLVASGSPEASNAGNRIGQRRVERAGINLIFFFSY